jgi:hypothetical protein
LDEKEWEERKGVLCNDINYCNLLFHIIEMFKGKSEATYRSVACFFMRWWIPKMDRASYVSCSIQILHAIKISKENIIKQYNIIQSLWLQTKQFMNLCSRIKQIDAVWIELCTCFSMWRIMDDCCIWTDWWNCWET